MATHPGTPTVLLSVLLLLLGPASSVGAREWGTMGRASSLREDHGGAAFLRLITGNLVTSTDSGLAVPAG